MNRLPRLIGVLHLPPLPGAPASTELEPAEALRRAGLQAVKEAQAFARAGFEAVIVENFGDVPFYKSAVPPETIASLGVIAAAVKESVRIPVGLNVLRNDARAALAIASVTGCEFIRVNVLSGLVAADQGLIEGEASALLRERQRLGAPVAILADVHVKHAKTLSSDDLSSAMEDTALRGLADGLIVSGSGTGKAVDPMRLATAARVAKSLGSPLYVGSGTSLDNLAEIVSHGAGIIVSSSLRKQGRPGAPLDPKRLSEFARAYRAFSRKKPSKRK